MEKNLRFLALRGEIQRGSWLLMDLWYRNLIPVPNIVVITSYLKESKVK
jgi:hypothetical protein